MKTEQELPVAARIVDKHGLVAVLRITPAGNAFFRQTVISKGHLRAREQGWGPEWGKLGDIHGGRRIFLDETSDETVPTYCSKGRHQVEIPIPDLRHRAAAFKAGEPMTNVVVS